MISDLIELSKEEFDALQLHDFAMCFPAIPEDDFAKLKEDISGIGVLNPITIAEGKIIDGRHRHRACVELGITCDVVEFVGPGSLLSYVTAQNAYRRHMSVREKAEAAVKVLDVHMARAKERQKKAGSEIGVMNLKNVEVQQLPEPVPEAVVEAGDARDLVAASLGISGRTVSDAKVIIEKGTDDDREAFRNETKSVKAIASDIREREKVERTKPRQAEYLTIEAWNSIPTSERATAFAQPSEASFNRQDNTSIEWAQWSWNPITGCKHDCPYCYARDIANRFFPQGFDPSILPSRFAAPANTKVPDKAAKDPAYKNVFTCSMADLFGRWVPAEWINYVLVTITENPQWNFLLLTKFANRMAEFQYPNNAWLGTSVDLQARVGAAEKAMEKFEAHVKWLSIEPLIEPITFKRPELFNWVVIGGASKSNETPEWQPPFEWVARLYMTFKDAGAAVYIKDNIGFTGPRRPREFPWTDIKAESAADVFHYLKNRPTR